MLKKSMSILLVISLLTTLVSIPLIYVQNTATAAGGGSIQVVYSSYNDTDTNNQLTQQANKSFDSINNTAFEGTITVDPSIKYQEWTGFGGSIEHDSIWELNRLSSANRTAALKALFDPATGNNYNLMRLSIACPDFCPDYNPNIIPDKGYWTYNDMPAGQTDVNLTNFSIQKDIDLGVISVLQEMLQINPNLKFYASMWSPPAWMKDNGKIIDGGHVLPKYYNSLANYYVKFIQAYEAQGIPIYGITLQNEPDISIGYPSTLWTTDEHMAFAEILGQAFTTNDIKVKVWGLDANEHVTFDYAKMLQNPSSAQYVDGFGFHNYTGQSINQSTILRDQYPDKTMHITEISNGAAKLIDYFRNWMSSYTYWLTFIEFMPGPGPGFWQDTWRDPAVDPDFWVDSQISWAGTPGSSSYKLNTWYYTYGQFSRFIQPGAVRIDSTGTVANDVSNVAFKNSDGTIVMIVVNRIWDSRNSVDKNTSAKTIKIVSPDGQFTDTIPGDTIATYKWTSTTGDELVKNNWSATASNTNGTYTASQAIDNKMDTVWTSGINEASGQTFTLNLGSSQTFDQVSMNQGNLTIDSPVSYQLYVSSDGTNWGSPIASGSGTSNMTNITFSSQTKQYIRIQLTGSATHWWSIADLSVYNTMNGLLPRNGWTASASATNGSDVASQAIDGTNTSRWSNGAAQVNGQWFQVDMGSTKSINKISIDSGSSSGDYAKSYDVYISNNGTTWGDPIASGVGLGQVIQASFPAQSARYIRVVQTGSKTNWWTISEFRVYNQNPLVLSRAGWSTSASATGSGTMTASVLDSNYSTRWTNGAAQANGQWFQLDMGKINTISGIALNAAAFTGDYPRGYQVQLSIDGTNWTAVANGSITAQDNLISFPVDFARYIRVTQTGSATNWWSIAELNVLGVSTTPSLGARLSQSGWSATASHTEAGGNPNTAIDGWLQAPRNEPYNHGAINYLATRWSSGKSQSGNEWFQVDLGATRTFNTVGMNTGPFDLGTVPNDHPRKFTVYVSNDGSNWTAVASGEGVGAVTSIKFPTVTARYVNINQTGSASNWWTIAEFNLYLQ